MSLVGENARRTFYYYIERRYGVSRDAIPVKLEVFGQALSGMLGFGAKMVERAIARALYSRLGLPFSEVSRMCFKDYVDTARTKWKDRPQVNKLNNNGTRSNNAR